MRNPLLAIATGLLTLVHCSVGAAPGGDVYETCPGAEDVGSNVECYPVTFTAKTEIHPNGIPLIGYLFVPKDRSDEPLSAIVFAHGSGSLYSDGNHNKGLNSTHLQWVRQYTNDLGIVGLHVSSFHSRYLLPDTEDDQRILDITHIPQGEIGVGGDDYRATSTLGYAEDEDGDPLPYTYLEFDPEQDGWKDASNEGAGVSEATERAYDMDAARDFLVGIRKGAYLENARNEDNRAIGTDGTTLGFPGAGEGYIGEIVNGGLVIDHERVFLYGTSHGGQTAMATAHGGRALDPVGPMNADLPEGSPLKRFAAFFDYYGGCGLHGAYGGTNNSTWQPYAPFLMFHGSLDDKAVFDEDDVPIDSLAEFAQTGCGKRIAAAKAAPDFEQFLEAIVYKDAQHSFDGIERDDVNDESDSDFGSWLAKVHANYRMTVPFMEAIGRRVAAERNEEAVPSLEALGFADSLPYFDTVPLTPYLGPQPVARSAFAAGEDIVIDDLGNAEIDLGTLLADPFEMFATSCALSDAIANITEPAECVIRLELTETQLNSSLPEAFWIHATTARGKIFIPVRLEKTGSGASGTLSFGQELYALPGDAVLQSALADSVRFPAEGLVWTRFSQFDTHAFRTGPFSLPPGYSIDGSRFIAGPVPTAADTGKFNAFVNGNLVNAGFTVSPLAEGLVSLATNSVNAVALNHVSYDTAALPVADFATGFVPLSPDGTGPGDGDEIDGAALYAAHCASCHGPLEDSERRNRSADQIRAAIDTEAMQALSFLTDEEIDAIAAALKSDSNKVPNPGPDRSAGGGGAFVWLLLPFALPLRRRH